MRTHFLSDLSAALLLLILATVVLWFSSPGEAEHGKWPDENGPPPPPSPSRIAAREPSAPAASTPEGEAPPARSADPPRFLESETIAPHPADPPPPETLEEVISLLQEAEGEGGGEQDFISATRRAIEELSQPQSAYERTYRELRIAGGVDLAPGVTVEALERRRGILRRMAAANEDLSQRIARLPTRIIELLGDSIPAEEVAEFVLSFEQGANIQGLLAERARARAFCADADELLSLLIAYPEGWRAVGGGQVVFEDLAAQDRYEYLVRMLRAHLSGGR